MNTMIHNTILKLLIVIALGSIMAFLIFSLYLGYHFYHDIFRLSSNQVSNSLSSIVPQCKKMSACKLLPGDILIRRYITPRTWLIDKLISPHFTHTAFYMGDDKLIEAGGTEKKSEDDIQIEVFSKTDWLDLDMNDFVVVRPKNYSQKLDAISNNLTNIAQDPNYTFGLPAQGYKRTTCADLIFKQLAIENVIHTSNAPQIVTPDYLFWATRNDPINFEIIGYNIEK